MRNSFLQDKNNEIRLKNVHLARLERDPIECCGVHYLRHFNFDADMAND
jgi:hypothetical protein